MSVQTVGELKFEILCCYSCDNEFVLIFIHFWLKLAIKKRLLKENLNYYVADCYLVLCPSFGLQYEGISASRNVTNLFGEEFVFLMRKSFVSRKFASCFFVCLFVCK